MKQVIKKTDILMEALPYFQQFRRKTFVIKVGGAAMEQEQMLSSILKDIVFLEQVGIRVIVVHGGGKVITRALAQKKIATTFVDGLRVTDRATIRVVEKVLVKQVNRWLVDNIKKHGGNPVGFSAADNGVLEVKKQYAYQKQGQRRKRIDLGYVGKITGIRTHPIYRLLNVEKIPVIAPLGLGPEGFVYNINADTAACEIAGRLKAEKLIFLTDVDGVYKNGKLVSTFTIPEVRQYVRRGIIKEGMIPKAASMIRALQRGVKKTHIINGMIPHSLLLEIYTDRGIGTEMVKG
jgi:acetylglutamate kinase